MQVLKGRIKISFVGLADDLKHILRYRDSRLRDVVVVLNIHNKREHHGDCPHFRRSQSICFGCLGNVWNRLTCKYRNLSTIFLQFSCSVVFQYTLCQEAIVPVVDVLWIIVQLAEALLINLGLMSLRYEETFSSLVVINLPVQQKILSSRLGETNRQKLFLLNQPPQTLCKGFKGCLDILDV